MSLSTNRGMSALMIQSINGSTVQCHVCVHRPMCCATLKNVTPPPPNPHISEMAFSCRFQKVYTYPPLGDDMFAHGSKTCRKCRQVPKPTKLAYSECPREIYWKGWGGGGVASAPPPPLGSKNRKPLVLSILCRKSIFGPQFLRVWLGAVRWC